MAPVVSHLKAKLAGKEGGQRVLAVGEILDSPPAAWAEQATPLPETLIQILASTVGLANTMEGSRNRNGEQQGRSLK